jgi:hypothetical protein
MARSAFQELEDINECLGDRLILIPVVSFSFKQVG